MGTTFPVMLELIAELFAAALEAILAYLFGGKKTRRVLHWFIVLMVLGVLGFFGYLYITRGF